MTKRTSALRACAVALALTVAVAAVGAPAKAPPQAKAPAAAAAPAPASRVLEALLAGRDARAAIAETLAHGPAPTPQLRAPATRALGGYVQSWRRVAAALDAARGATTLPAAQRSRAALRAALDALPAQRLLLDARLEQVDAGLARLPGTIQSRWGAQRSRLVAAADGLDAAARDLAVALARVPDSAETPQALLAELSERIAAALPDAAPVYGAALPVSRPRFAPRAPATAPAVTPAYLDAEHEIAPGADDLDPGADAPLTPAVLAKAASLGHDYTRIYDFVRSSVRTQWYAGQQKSVDTTLRTLAGNDVDQASLLIALLRASRAPARYVRGVVEVPLEDLSAMLGVRADKVGQALAAAGVPNRPVARAGRIGAYAIEHVYVSAYVPFSNYRGTTADLAGSTWIPLAPALKPYRFVPAAGALAKAGVAPATFLADYLGAPQTVAPLELLQQAVRDGLSRLSPPVDYATQVAVHDVDAAPLELLPATLPYPATAVTGEFARLPDALRQYAHVVVRTGADAASAIALDKRIALADLLDRRVTLAYAPASIDDGLLVDAKGGMSAAPPSLFRVRPVLNVGGQPAAQGTADIETGAPHRLEITLESAAGSATLSQQLTAGGLAAIVFDAQGEAPAMQDATTVLLGESDTDAAKLLWNFGARYLADWDRRDNDYARLVGVGVLRPLPSVALVINQYEVNRVAGVVDTMTWKGVALDAALHAVEPFAQSDNATAESDWMNLAALEGSVLEHQLFEQQWLVESVSADKGLALARAQNRPVLTLTAATGTSGLNQPQDVVDAIAGWLSRGYVVEVPRDPLTVQAWTGAVWRVTAPATGESGYFIAGRLAGGATALPPELWYFRDIVALLAMPYALQPNQDPLSGVALLLDKSAQDQAGIAGQELHDALAVAVIDAVGRPVQGATVAFSVSNGTARLATESNGATDVSVTVVTDRHGRARAWAKLGEQTGDYGAFVLEEGKTYPQWIGRNDIEVYAVARVGLLNAGEPFHAATLPDVPAKLTIVGDPQRKLMPGMGYLTFRAEVTDRFDNSVSNVGVALGARTHYRTPVCRTTPDTPATEDAKLFVPGQCPIDVPRLTGSACADLNIATQTRPGGAPFFVVPPNMALATVQVTANAAGLDKTVDLATDDAIFDGCRYSDGYAIIGWVTVPWSGYVPWIDETLVPIDAAAPDYLLPRPLRTDAFYSRMAAGDYGIVSWAPIETAQFDFDLVNGSGENVRNLGGGGYLFDLRAGSTPGPITGDVFLRFGNQRVSVRRRNGSDSVAAVNDSPMAWSVQLDAPTVTPTPVPLTAYSVTDAQIRVTNQQTPTQYRSAPSLLQVLDGDDVLRECAMPLADGTSYCQLPRGNLLIDRSHTYKVRTVLNDGTPYRLESPTRELKFGQGIIAGYGVLPQTHPSTGATAAPARAAADSSTEIGLVLGHYPRAFGMLDDVDVASGYACTVGQRFGFVLEQRATVTLTFLKKDRNGNVTSDVVSSPIDHQTFDAGLHDGLIVVDQLPYGEFGFKLEAVAEDGTREAYDGSAERKLRRQDSLPLGHPFVKGVDLYSGGAVLSEEDIALGGRGPGMKLTRTYTSHRGNEKGNFGRGWASDLDAQVIVDACDTRVVTGAAGQGQRYAPAGLSPAGDRLFTALNGFHGTLLQHTDGTYDFYSKDGTRYRFEFLDPGESAKLVFIEDTNGNRVGYSYELGENGRRVARMSDAAGRSIDLTWRDMDVRAPLGVSEVKDRNSVVVAARGPGGIALSYEYDEFGNLVKTTRGADGAPGVRQTHYDYRDYGGVGVNAPGQDPRYTRIGFRLIAATNLLDGAQRKYAYDGGWTAFIDSSAHTQYEYEQRVSVVTEPDTQTTQYTYTGVRGLSAVTTDVRNERGYTTHYALNRYGAAETVTDALNHSTLTQWDMVHIQPHQVTDAAGTVTTYTYDAAGNTTNERIENGSGSITRAWTYAPQAQFTPPYIRNRPLTSTDGNGHLTTYAYDTRGNRTSTTRGGVTETDAYDKNGDHVSRVDGRGKTWSWRYDVYGYPREARDPLQNAVLTTYDVRGRKLSETDPNGATTSTIYDALDRPLVTTLPATDAGTAQHTVAYDDAHDTKTETDPLSHATTYTYDRMGRLVDVHNPAGDDHSYVYDEAGNKKSETDFGGHVTTYVYDAANRLTDTQEPEGRTTHVTYDAAGHVTDETVGSGADDVRLTHYRYEHPLYKRTQVERKLENGALFTLEQSTYDGNGNVTSKLDAMGRVTTFEYDERDRLTTQTAPLGRVVVFGYDDADHKTSEIRRNPSGSSDQTRTWRYDDAGRLVETIDATGASRTQSYDPAGNVLTTSDALGHVTRKTYDARHHVLTETGPETGQLTSYVYDRTGNRTEEHAANGRVVRHQYDELDRPTTTTDNEGNGAVEILAYTPDGQVLRRTDANGHVTLNHYDDLHRLIQVDLPSVGTQTRTLHTTYDAHGDVLTETDAGGHQTAHRYDTRGRRTQTTYPDAGDGAIPETFDYDDAGNVLKHTDAAGRITRSAYDALDRRIEQTQTGASGEVTQTWAYDQVGNVIRHDDGRGITTLTTYDKENRPTGVMRDGLLQSITEYDAQGNVTRVTDALNRITNYAYDRANRKIEEKRPLGATQTWTYTPLGDVAGTTDADGKTTTRDYDRRRRLSAETNAAGESTTYQYDGEGHRTRLHRPNGTEWNYAYDAADRLRTVSDPLGNVTTFRYDADGNRVELEDARHHVTGTTYDARHRMTAKTYPATASGTAVHRWQYDGAGLVLLETTPNGRVLHSQYDGLGRRTRLDIDGVVAGEAATTTWQYDGNGNVLQIEEYPSGSGARTETRRYDSFDRAVQVRDVHGATLNYQYDAVGNRTQLTDSDSQTTHWSYDALNRNTGVTVPGQGTTQQAYTLSGRLSAITRPDGSTSETTYDDAWRVKTIVHAKAGATVARYAYRYDLNGNRLEQKETNGGAEELTSYEYDDADRLTVVHAPDRTTTYTLDAVGNRTHEKVTDAANASTVLSDSTLTYNERDQLTSRADSVRGVNLSLSYDADGNQTSQTEGSQTRTYAYDGRNRMVTLTLPGASAIAYDYDPAGLRIGKVQQGGVAAHYQYDQGSLLAESNLIGNTATRYHYGATQLLSRTEGNATSPTQRQYLLDALHSPIALLTQDGALSARTQYDAFGLVRRQVGTDGSVTTPDLDGSNAQLPSADGQGIGFTGYQKDGESGLYYAKARYYDAKIARFTSEDPEDGQAQMPPSLHRYLYAYANPTVYFDPTGRQSVDSPRYALQQTYYMASTQQEREIARRSLDQYDVAMRARASPTATGIAHSIIKNEQRLAQLAADAIYTIPEAVNTWLRGDDYDVGSRARVGAFFVGLGDFISDPVGTIDRSYRASLDASSRQRETGDNFGADALAAEANMDLVQMALGGPGLARGLTATRAGLARVVQKARFVDEVDSIISDAKLPDSGGASHYGSSNSNRVAEMREEALGTSRSDAALVSARPARTETAIERSDVLDSSILQEPGPIEALLYGARKGEGLPGWNGVAIDKRPSPRDLELLTAKHEVEFAVTYKLGPGKNGGGGQYYLFSGDISSVRVPRHYDSMLIYHTHPGGTPWASAPDMAFLEFLEAIGSPQRSSQIVPVGKDVIRFSKDKPRF